jgi:hypothetical protein
MTLSRRKVSKSANTISLAGAAYPLMNNFAFAAPSLPDKSSFGKMDTIYLNSATQHPISLASSRSAEL